MGIKDAVILQPVWSIVRELTDNLFSSADTIQPADDFEEKRCRKRHSNTLNAY
jgi:hypothetical protein